MLSPRMPELAALEMLATVHDLGSLSAAGKRLGLSQQAVSSRMRSLEARIGSVLLTRTPRGSALTETGALLAGWAADVLSAAERLDAGIAVLRGEGARRLKVAASQTVAEHLLPQWLVALRRQQEELGVAPTVVELVVSNSMDTAELVRSGQAVIGFIESPHLPPDLSSASVREDEMLLVVAPAHPWARRRSPVTVGELAATALVTRERGSGTRDALEYLLDARGTNPVADPLLELTTTASVRSGIAAGTAPGVLSALAVKDDLILHRLVSVPVDGLPLRRKLSVLWQTGSTPPSGPARDLAAIAARPANGTDAR
ncbi:LysR family transcriptional regulator [Arthrobacter sp. GMC3]|uniref:LysR family transcriptional regulator n=1 Tax=Arthrobacter sp. GMC3 TaxID=2058894 RepID=UPI000CE4974D|nr:LysR family transcriptional regulator [Arthrobacter sp. GMC3]